MQQLLDDIISFSQRLGFFHLFQNSSKQAAEELFSQRGIFLKIAHI